MEADALRYLLRAIEMQNISRAAEALGLSQPALSRQIGRLEDELGQRLLVRNGRGVAPTAAGRRLASEAALILSDLDDLAAAMREEGTRPNGVVNLALPASVSDGMLPRLLDVTAQRFPGVSIKVTEALSNISADLLRNRTVDLAILYERADTEGLTCEKLIDEPLCLISPRGGDLGEGPVIDFATVEDIKLILPSRSSGLRRMLEQEATRRGLALNVAVEIEAVGAMKNLVAAGLGHCILPKFSVAREVAAGTLVARPIGSPNLTRGLVTARLALRPPGPATVQVAQAIRDAAAGD